MAFRANPDCIVCSYGDGIAVLNRKTSDYFSLDPVGATVWEAIEAAPQSGVTSDEVVSIVVDRFDVEPDTCRPDILAFFDMLKDARLIEKAS
ncbi:hypothetical protein LCGC14_0497780 [marine sediment metagenome]|uniref:PqqD family protein n=1 Tax=marine sediment metagenome TaxID=412755 RepID=A0A0F9VDJ2_9ZZZZ